MEWIRNSISWLTKIFSSASYQQESSYDEGSSASDDNVSENEDYKNSVISGAESTGHWKRENNDDTEDGENTSRVLVYERRPTLEESNGNEECPPDQRPKELLSEDSAGAKDTFYLKCSSQKYQDPTALHAKLVSVEASEVQNPTPVRVTYVPLAPSYRLKEHSNTKQTNPKRDRKLKYYAVLKFLNLDPAKPLTLAKARVVDEVTHRMTDELTSCDQVSQYILKKLMLLDYRAREFKIKPARLKRKYLSGASDSDDNDDDDNDDNDDDNYDDKRVLQKGMINPMDAFLSLFYCSDHFLQKDLCIRLSSCQLSVPFLLPNPERPSEKITILLSALESIKKTWKTNSSGRAKVVFVTEHPFPVVSFIRIDCEGGGNKRKIVDGLVEVCWYVPGGREEEAFEREICLANLRGDATDFRKQLDILLRISSVIFLILPSEIPDPSTEQILQEVKKTETKITLLFNEKLKNDAKQHFNGLKGELSWIVRAVQGNEHDFVQRIRGKINKNMKKVKAEPLRKLRDVCVNDRNIHFDIVRPSSSQWLNYWKDWLKCGPHEAKTKLKLQTLALKFGKLMRENYSSKFHVSKKEKDDDTQLKIRESRQRQAELLKGMDKKVKFCLNGMTCAGDELQVYLKFIKHELDNMTLEVHGNLQEQYRVKWLEIQSDIRERQQRNLPTDNKISPMKRLEELEKSIADSSFGLEHLIRETAQMYELSDTTQIDYQSTAADILLSGHPLELLDGDSSYVPLRWLGAVFDELQRKTNNAKIFVISVLGIQSSGKSTMLNAMFGLEFAVSAGRCTRGAFASLIPLSSSLQLASKLDYLMIIDTEGLRGSADPLQREHDNELATFVIGLADLTIVNIFGENHNEIEEFLEIAVHAFLKMKLVNEKRMCKIVHQNVTAVDASDLLATDRIGLKRKLDKMAKLAATQEVCRDKVQELNDILSFNENEDVFYLPNLLQGSPPMAPINPDYGRAVHKVKETIISVMCASKKAPLSISQFQNRIFSLWKAILRENFIFSLRNTIEVRAYMSLDQKYFEESVKTMVMGMSELEKTIQVSLMRGPASVREQEWAVFKVEIEEKAKQLAQKMKEAMETFFENNEDKATLGQWRENIMFKIDELQESQRKEITKNCQAAFDYYKQREAVDEKKQRYEKELLENARKFMQSVNRLNNIHDCMAKFQDVWQKWLKDIPESIYERVDVNKEMISVLLKADKTLTTQMTKQLQVSRELSQCKKSFSAFMHLAKEERFKKHPEHVGFVVGLRKDALRTALDFAEEQKKSHARCRRGDITTMYQIASSPLRKNREKYQIPQSVECDTLITIFANAFDVFMEMEDNYLKERDIKGNLEMTLKPDLEKYFVNVCEKMQSETLAATSLVDKLKENIENELNKRMGPAVANALWEKNQYQSKGKFHASVLLQLAKDANFSAYTEYFESPITFLQEKLAESIKNDCLHDQDSRINSLLETEVKKIKDEILRAIDYANRQTNDKSNFTYSFWIERFVECCHTLAITKEMFSVVSINDDLKDLDMFHRTVCDFLLEFLKSVVERGIDGSVFENWDPVPHEKLQELMFGCQSCCPFCRALCDKTSREHEGEHSSKIHRPQGIIGYHDHQTKILSHRICTFLVSGEGKFSNPDTHGEWHLYKEYQSLDENYASWEIVPDTSFETSLYWKWFMAKFSKELAEHYGVNKPNIPKSWKTITLEDAEKQMRDHYKLIH